MFVLETIWETIKWNHTKENKCMILSRFEKPFKYQYSQWSRNNKSCLVKQNSYSNETKIYIT